METKGHKTEEQENKLDEIETEMQETASDIK